MREWVGCGLGHSHHVRAWRLPARPEGKKAAQFMMALAAVSTKALLSAHGYNVERTLKVLDTWAAEYAADRAAADDRS